MGNSGQGGKGNYKRKPKRAEESGETKGVGIAPGGGAQGGGSDSLVLNIVLVKLDLTVLQHAAPTAKGDTVEVRWAGVEYDAFWKGQRLGSVPGNYNDQLQYPESHRGRLTDISEQPRLAVIRVTVSR